MTAVAIGRLFNLVTDDPTHCSTTQGTQRATVS